MGVSGVRNEYKVDLRWDDGAQQTDQVTTPDVELALTAYRALLSRNELGGKSVAARFLVNGKSLYFSRFNRPYGQKHGRSRIHPRAPLDPHLDPQDYDKINEIMAWTPSGHLITPAPERLYNAAGRDIEVEKLSAELVVKWLAPMARANRREFQALAAMVARDCAGELEGTDDGARREALLAAHAVIEGLRKAAG